MLHNTWLFRYSMPIAVFFFFNDTATTEIYTLSLHDALPILMFRWIGNAPPQMPVKKKSLAGYPRPAKAEKLFSKVDRKSTRLNSSHSQISYAVFCLKKKK